MSSQLTKRERNYLLLAVGACLSIIANTFQKDGEPLIASLAFSGIAFSVSYALIRWLGPKFIRAGLKGRDLCKTKSTEIPECMGAVCAVVYLLIVIVFIPFPFYKDIIAATSGGGNRDTVIQVQELETGRLLHKFPHSKLASYLSAILSLQSVVLLGVGDDLFDIRWRHKILIPAFASIPVLIVYFVDFGVTQVVIPTQLRPYLGPLFDLGWLYYVYMAAIAIFCPNSINIVAGINGLEVGQSIIIASLIILNDIIYLYLNPLTASSTPSFPHPHPATDSHLFSVYFLLPFLGVSLALFAHNRYPARVFVGDTYCYFAGMIFAIIGILGHFSKTLLLLFIPQIFNFIYSAPQLFHLIPCPRHRLPHLNPRTGLLEPSFATVSKQSSSPPPSPTTTTPTTPTNFPFAIIISLLRVLARLRLVALRTAAGFADDTGMIMECPNGDASGSGSGSGTSNGSDKKFKRNIQPREQVIEVSNLTILNLWLVWFGPMREDRLARGLLLVQLACGLFGLFIRHRLALYVFTEDNL